MFKRFILSLIGVAIVTASASAQYYPPNPYQQNPNNPYQQHYPYQDQGTQSAQNRSGHTPIGHPSQPQKNYYYCQTHNQYCGHTPYTYNNQNNQGTWHNGQYRPANGQGTWHNGQYRPANDGQGYWHNGQYRTYNNNGRYNPNDARYNNNGHRSWRRGQGNNNPPPGHYYCNTHNMYCSH